jgi:hypothetical protein
MNAKWIMAALAAVLLTFSICSLTLGARGAHAVANDSQGLFIPEVDENWNVSHTAAQNRYQSPSPSRSESNVTASTTASQRHAAADRRAKEKGNAEIARETEAAGFVRTVLPWLAGTFAVFGLAMVIYGLSTRHGRVSSEQKSVPWVILLHGSREVRIKKAAGTAGLASRLARAQQRQTQDQEEKDRKVRRAA